MIRCVEMEVGQIKTPNDVKQAHVVVLPLPTRGHVNPMMELAKLLADAEILVTFIMTPDNRRIIGEVTLKDLQERFKQCLRFVELPDGLAPEVNRSTNVLDLCESVLSAMAHPFHELVASLKPHVSCIIADTWMTFALQTANHFHIPFANFWTQSAISFTSLLMVARGYRPPPEPEIPGASYIQSSELNTFVQCYDLEDFMFRFVIGGFDSLSQSRWIIMNTFDDLEHETLQHLIERENLNTILTVGPLLPSKFTNCSDESITNHSFDDGMATMWSKEEDCLTWLDKFEPRSVLYVAFGSLALVSTQQIEEIAIGLEASGYPFLWVTRPNLINGQSPNFNDNFLNRVKGRAYFVPWAPQLKVLTHNSIGGFFTHGGWNSTLESLTTGIPMLGWPYFSDQPMDCKCIESGWNVGLRLQDEGAKGLIKRDLVESKVKRLMTSKAFHDKASFWSSLAKKAAKNGGSSKNNFNSFVKALKSKTL